MKSIHSNEKIDIGISRGDKGLEIYGLNGEPKFIKYTGSVKEVKKYVSKRNVRTGCLDRNSLHYQESNSIKEHLLKLKKYSKDPPHRYHNTEVFSYFKRPLPLTY
jgi:hypothetical protein